MKLVQEVARTPVQHCRHRKLSPTSGESSDQGPRSLTPKEVRMELVQEIARTSIRQSEAGSTGQAVTKRAAAAVSMTCRQLQPQPVDMWSLREAFARDASRRVRLANGQCSDQMRRPGAPGPCGGCSPTKQGSGTSVTAACSAHSEATGCSKHHPSSMGDDAVRGLVEQAIEVTFHPLRHFFVTAGMQLGVARGSFEDAGVWKRDSAMPVVNNSGVAGRR